MADGDRIIIDGANFNNSELPMWSTEKTQSSVLKLLQETLNVTEKQQQRLLKAIKGVSRTNNDGTDEISKILKNVSDSVAETSKSTDKLTVSGKKKAATEKTFAQNFKADTNKLFDSMKKKHDPKNLLPTGIVKKFSGSLMKASKWLGPVGIGLGLLSSGIGYVVGRIFNMDDAFKDVYDSGIRFSGQVNGLSTGFAAMGRIAGESAMSIDELAGYLTTFSGVAKVLGERSFANLAKQVRRSTLEFGNFGLMSADINEYLGEYLEQNRRLGLTQLMDDNQRKRAFQDNMRQLTAYSSVLGKARKQIADEVSGGLEAANFITSLNSMPEEIRTNVKESAQHAMNILSATTGKSGDQLVNMLSQSVATGMVGFTEYGESLMMASPTVAASMQTLTSLIRSGTASQEEVQAATVSFVNTMGDLSEEDRQRLINLIKVNDGSAAMAELLGLVNAELANTPVNVADLNDRINNADGEQSRLAIARANFTESINNLRGMFDNLFATVFTNDLVMGWFGDGIEGADTQLTVFSRWLSTKVNVYLEKFGTWLESFDKDGKIDFGEVMAAAMVNIRTAIDGFINDMFDLMFEKIRVSLNSWLPSWLQIDDPNDDEQLINSETQGYTQGGHAIPRLEDGSLDYSQGYVDNYSGWVWKDGFGPNAETASPSTIPDHHPGTTPVPSNQATPTIVPLANNEPPLPAMTRGEFSDLMDNFITAQGNAEQGGHTGRNARQFIDRNDELLEQMLLALQKQQTLTEKQTRVLNSINGE